MSEPRPLTQRGRPHGRVSSWVLVAVVIAAFAAGGGALILHLWVVFWVCVAVIVLSVPIGKAVGVMEDTVGWTLPMPSWQRRQYGSVSAAAEDVRQHGGAAEDGRKPADEGSPDLPAQTAKFRHGDEPAP